MFAVAKQYSGTVSDAAGRLPAVRDFQIWNEPNIPAYLAPQWKGHKSFSAPYYRRMLNAGYEGVKDAATMALACSQRARRRTASSWGKTDSSAAVLAGGALPSHE